MGAALASVASVVSLIGALSCCLPLGTLLMSAGAAGASVFSETLRPWLLVVSVAALVFAFAQTYYLRVCNFRYRRFRTILLWFSAALVVSMLAAPGFVPSLVAGRLPWVEASGPLRTFRTPEFIRDFDAASGQTRVVVLLSPT